MKTVDPACYTLSGTHPALTMRCEMDGHAFSNTMKPESVMPVAPLPVFELPLEKRSEKTFDDKLPQATQTGVTLTSKGKARLVFCEEK